MRTKDIKLIIDKDKDDYNNFKSYLICAGGALAVSENILLDEKHK